MKVAAQLAVVLACLAATARADRIHLENGNVFDDVVLVSHTEEKTRFLVGSGEMSLPSSWIARVERAPGALAEYLDRSRALSEQERPSAQAYLELARWARSRGLDHGFRESLRAAAELQPDLEGLAPLMTGAGYRLDEAVGAWVPVGSERPRAAERAPAPRPTSTARASDFGRSEAASEPNVEIAAGLTRAIETLARAELERSRRPSGFRTARVERRAFPVAVAPVALVSTGWVFPGVPLRGAETEPDNPVIRKPANPHARALLARPPGSLLPVSAYRH